MTIDWAPLVKLIKERDRFLITSHIRGDCDAIGSEIALARILKSLGKQATIVNGDEVPEHIAFLDPDGWVKVAGGTAPLEALRGFETLVVVDTSAWVQLGAMAQVVRGFQGVRILIDHHESGDDMGAVTFKDVEAEATGRLIVELAEALGVALTSEMAMPLFTAIATDTGWFRFPSVTDKTFAAGAKLVAAGASPTTAFAVLYERHSFPRLRLRGRILDHVRQECDGRLLWTYVTENDFAECGAQLTDTEDAINMLLAVANVEVAALFVELEPAVTKVSLRSRGVDIRAVAEQFGGGGHKLAAGITVRQPMQESQRAILDVLCKSMG